MGATDYCHFQFYGTHFIWQAHQAESRAWTPMLRGGRLTRVFLDSPAMRVRE